jgi:hypothetical protein
MGGIRIMGATISQTELKRRVNAGKFSQYFFSKGAMEFFNSRLESVGYVKPYSDRVYFVTSEQFQDEPREYKVRVFDGEHVDVVSDENYAALDEAVNAAIFNAGLKPRGQK